MWSFEIYFVVVTQKLRSLLGGSKAAIIALEPPCSFLNLWATSKWCTSKDPIFSVEWRSQHKKHNLFWKSWKKSKYKMPLYLAAEKGHFTK